MRFSFTTFNYYRESLLRLVYPTQCGACQAPLEINERAACNSCKDSLEKIQLDFSQSTLDINIPGINQAWAIYPYESPIKELLTGIKFHNKRWLIPLFAKSIEALAALITAEHSYDGLVPIPLDSLRLLERQFNQAEVIAHLLQKKIHIPTHNILRKNFHTLKQSGLNQKQRKKNLHFAFSTSYKVEGKTFLLIDDILTTGATAQEAARVLREKGAKRVDVFALAYSFGPDSQTKKISSLYTSPASMGY